jgi:threonine synthase
MSAYCTKAGMEAVVLFPRLTPSVYIEECHAHGARVILVDGLINDCAIKAKEINRSGEYFDLSTLKEPYRIEGKKTMGYEIAESLNWKLPDVIVYPTGGGTGLIGIWKAFKEMQELGWIGDYLPKMVSVQSENCRPVVDHWEGKRISISTYQPSIALGLNVPLPFGKNLIMKCLRVSKGTAIAVSEADIKHWMHKIWQKDGILTSPEGASALAGISKLAKSGFLKPDDQVLMLSTGGGLKHLIEE